MADELDPDVEARGEPAPTNPNTLTPQPTPTDTESTSPSKNGSSTQTRERTKRPLPEISRLIYFVLALVALCISKLSWLKWNHRRKHGSPQVERQRKRRCHERIWFFFSNIGLAFVYHGFAKVFRWHPRKEEEKVVIDHSRPTAMLRGLVHVIPTGGCLILITINCASYYIGGELTGQLNQDSQKLAALQFAAKIHELFMLVSLGLIIVTYIRRQLLMGNGLPFGAIFAPSGFQNISFLWSMEFWGICGFQDWQSRTRQWFAIFMMVSCSILGFSVGPSSATLMRPRLDKWPGGGTSFWIDGSSHQLFPTVIAGSLVPPECLTDEHRLDCPAANWKSLEQNYYSLFQHLPMGLDDGTPAYQSMPNEFYIQSPNSLRTLNLVTRAPMIWTNAYTASTAPISPLADAMTDLVRIWSATVKRHPTSRLKFHRDVFFTVESQQPAVFARCIRQLVQRMDGIPEAAFPVLSSIPYVNGMEVPARVEPGLGLFVNLTDTIRDRLSLTSPSVEWFDDEELTTGVDGSIVCLVAIPNPDPDEENAEFYSCSMKAAYSNTTYESRWARTKVVNGHPPAFFGHGDLRGLPTLRIQADWARYLNPSISHTNSTAFTEILRTSGLWPPPRGLNGTTGRRLRESIVESMIAGLMANGLSRIAYNHSLILDDLEDSRGMIPTAANLGRGAGAFHEPASPAESTKFELLVDVEGFAYTPEGASRIATMTVLGLYILLVTVHCIWSFWTGQSSAAWGKPPEVAALALQSAGPAALANSGAGIETIKVFESRVQMKVLDGKLEMTFDDTDTDHHELARANETYG